MAHIPVLTKEVLEYLNPKANENFVDATVGEGGHSAAIIEKNNPNGKILGIEWDSEVYNITKSRIAEFPDRIILVNDSYINLKEIVEKENFKPVNGILLDLGMSSYQLEKSGRGFSFMKNEMLDMRYNSGNQKSKIKNQNYITAENIVNEWSQEKIEEILNDYGEERFARQIAKKIVEKRKVKKISSTFELKDIIKEAMPSKFLYGKIHFATRTFQAIRITVNEELDNLTEFLPKAIEVLSSGGRLVVISFHSLEDRIVKSFFKNKSQQGLVKILTKKPIAVSRNEVLVNPRSRSAKLRAIIKN